MPEYYTLLELFLILNNAKLEYKYVIILVNYYKYYIVLI